MSDPKFIHLHLHTEYSLVDGIVRIAPLIESCVQQKIPAVAVTDQSNLFATIKFFKAALAAGIKPIIGAEVLLAAEGHTTLPRVVLLCQNDTGYKNLTQLISKSYTQGQQQGVPIIQPAWLDELNAGLLAIAVMWHSDINQALLASNRTQAMRYLAQWQKWFPDRFYLELQRIGLPNEEAHLQATLQLARENKVPVVASNNVRFLQADDFAAHEARVCIHAGEILNDPARKRRYTENQYLRTQAEMLDLFADVPAALANTGAIAKRCNVMLTLGKVFLPAFPTPSHLTVEKFLAHEAENGLQKRLQAKAAQAKAVQIKAIQQNQQDVYQKRLLLELKVINSMGFAGYFLIVADFIRWAKEEQIPVGPGRGSGAGSLVAYALNITDLDPLDYDLLFERFLNPERISMPDFDIDFCMEGRDRVIDYVAKRYGRRSVAQIITFGTMAAKAVVRDVGRVLGHPYGYVDKLAKLIPFELGITLAKALAQEEALKARYDQEEEVKALIDLAMKLEGIVRNAGKHAGGVVIAPTDLTEFTPLYCEEGSDQIVTQFDKDDVETIGLVKFDFLGLRTLTIIDWTLQTINQKYKDKINIASISMTDKKTFDLLKACKTTGVFQLESRGMKDLIKRLQPDCFEDIIALVALFRPGPLQSGMVDDFIDRKHGRAEITYLHSALKPILQSTYGVILYQEQVMQIAQVLAGYTLGGADVLRRAMGKKKPAEMAKQRTIFLEGASKRKVNGEKINGKIANAIFDLMEKFAGYGFNKSHSAAYALLSYQTAWLKANYPAAFMAAVLSADMDHTEKVVNFMEDCRLLHLKVLPPAINQCHYQFSVRDDHTIQYGLGAIKGAGESAIECILQSRQQQGAFKSLFELCQRVDLRKVNKRVLEALVRSGALDEFAVSRACLFASIETALRAAEQHAHAMLSGQTDLFSQGLASADLSTTDSGLAYQNANAWSDEYRLQGEKETLGFYMSGHPIARFEEELNAITTAKIAELDMGRSQTAMIAGMITAVRTKITKRGDRMAFITLEDRSGRVDLVVFAGPFMQYREWIQKDALVVIEVDINVDTMTGSCRLGANRIFNLAQARAVFAKYLSLTLSAKTSDTSFSQRLKQVLTPFVPGNCPISVEYQNHVTHARLDLGQDWWVNPTDQLLDDLHKLDSVIKIKFCY